MLRTRKPRNNIGEGIIYEFGGVSAYSIKNRRYFRKEDADFSHG